MRLRDIIEQQQELGRKIGLLLDEVQIAAPRGSNAAALRLSWTRPLGSGFEPGGMTVPPGVKVLSWSKPADTFMRIDLPGDLDILALAWWAGSPDCARYEMLPAPGSIGYRDAIYMQFGGGDRLYVFANGRPVIDVMTDPRVRDLIPAAERCGYVYWRICITRGQYEWRTADATLAAHGGRDDALPSRIRPAPLGFRQRGHDHAGHITRWIFCRHVKKISLEEYERLKAVGFPRHASRRKRERPATPKQVGYISALLLRAGDRDTAIPGDLTLRQASRWIDDLLTDLGGA